jgi:putative copper export protein
MSAPAEPRNPFYFLLLVAGLVFIMTVLAYAVIPVLEEKARDAGTEPPPSWFRDSLRQDGWKWVLAEVALLVVLGLASMGLDRYRRWKKERESSP